MYFKHPAARAAMFALATLLLFNTAHAESLERFKGIEAWEGEYTFSFEKSDNIDGVVYTWSYQGSGSIHVSDPDIARRKDRLKWSGKTPANFNGREAPALEYRLKLPPLEAVFAVAGFDLDDPEVGVAGGLAGYVIVGIAFGDEFAL